MRFILAFLGMTAWAMQQPAPLAPPAFREATHPSQSAGGERGYRILLPAAYAQSKARYPVMYWLTGFEQSNAEREAEFVRYVGSHDVIVVQTGPLDPIGDFPLYIPDLVDHIDKTWRTNANRDHRGITGFGQAGYGAWMVAGKFPDLFGSASSFAGPTEASAGPKYFDVTYSQDDLYANLEGVKTLQLLPPGDKLDFYYRRLDSVWMYTRMGHETLRLDSAGPAAGIAEMLDFHLASFRTPLPRPASLTHIDAWPNFTVAGWQAVSNRRQPGFTILENAGPQGFRSAIREWYPSGSTIPGAKFTVTSPALGPPGAVRPVTYVHLRDGKVRTVNQKADAQGRLTFDLDGDAYEVGIGAVPVITVSGYEFAGDSWATQGQPVKLRVKFWNKGGARFVAGDVKWESPNAGVQLEPATSRLFALAPGESAVLPVTATLADATQPMVRIVAVVGAARFPLDVPLFPAAPAPPVFRIDDGATVEVFQHAVEHAEQAYGSGNGDGHVAPGETFAILIPDGEWLRAAELIGADPCLDMGLRGEDSWTPYDRSNNSARYSLPALSASCTPGKPIRMLARILYPDYRYRYYTIEFPVWYAK